MKISKRSPLLFLALLVAMFLVSACGTTTGSSNLSAGDILQKSFNVMKQLKTAHIDTNLNLQASDTAATPTATGSSSSKTGVQLPSNITVTLKGSGDEQLPDQTQMNLSVGALGTTTQVGEVTTADKVYVQTQGKWYVINKSDYQNSASATTGIFSGLNIDQNSLLGIVQNAKIVDHSDENLNGQSLRHITASLDKNSLKQLLTANPQLAKQLGQQNIDTALNALTLRAASVDLWISETQFYLYRTELKLDLTANTSNISNSPVSSVTAKLDSTVDLSKFNQPVTITPPTDATPITNAAGIFGTQAQQ